MPAAAHLPLLRLPLLLLPAGCAAGAVLLSELAESWTTALWTAAALGLLSCAWLGEQLPGSGANLRYAGVLLAASAGLRGLGGVLRAPCLAATALPVECYAAATLAGERRRRWPPRAEGLLYALALPADSLLQHSLDDGLRHAG
jgi:hypothetical protein